MSPRHDTDRAHRRSGALIALAWAALLAGLASLLFGFPGERRVQQFSVYYCAAAIIAAVAIVARFAPRNRRETSIHERTSAPAMAIAFALAIGGLSWVYGIFLVYFDIPLVAFAIARWRAERVGGRAS